MLFTFTLVKRIGIAVFLRPHFFGFTQSFRIFDQVFVYNRKKVIFAQFLDFRLQYLFCFS